MTTRAAYHASHHPGRSRTANAIARRMEGRTMFWKPLLPLGAVLALVAEACGGSAEVGSGDEDDPRVIEVSALDTLAYDPTAIEVGAGETVRFVVTNDGETDQSGQITPGSTA